MKMNGGRARSEISAIVLATDRIDRILPQVPLLRGQLYRLARGIAKSKLIERHGAIYIENYAAGILANRLGLGFRQLDVFFDDLHRAFGDRSLLLLFERIDDR